MNTKFLSTLGFIILHSSFILSAHAQGTAFTYQGRLNHNSTPANGSYDLQFAILDAPVGGSQIGSAQTANAVAVSNGLFTVTLDFGAGVFTGANRWLFLSVKTNGAVSFASLTPLQHITASPYAVTAGNLSGALPSAGLSGTYANAVTLNNGANSFSGNGAGLTNVNATSLGGLGAANFWVVGGNAGAGGAGLGTGDSQPLKLIAGNRRVLQLETRSVLLGLFDSWSAVNTLGGASGNVISNGVMGGTIAGGGAVTNHLFGSEAAPNTVLDNFGTVGGGLNNTAGYASTNFDDARAATVAGGEGNTSGNWWATVGGGLNNVSSGFLAATVAGGIGNRASDSYATVGGGFYNLSSGEGATVPGGLGNYATGGGSFAAGAYAQAVHDGAFVWADVDPIGNPYSSTGTNQFCVRARGGIQVDPQTSMYFGAQTRQMLNLYNASYGIGVQAATLYFRCDASSGEPFGGFRWYRGGGHNDATGNAGGGTELMSLGSTYLYVNGTFVSSSDRNVKENFTPVQPREVLEKVVALPITRWNYKSDAATPHLGPVAQDFYAAFAIGPDDKHITTVDESGVALAAIQGLNQKVEEQRAELQSRDALLKSQQEQIAALLERLGALEQRLEKPTAR